MLKKRIAGFIWKNKYPYLDHLAPFCSLLNIPLIVTEDDFADLAKKAYPKLKIIKNTDYSVIYKFLAENFDIVFSCQFFQSDSIRKLVLATFSDKINTVWMSHGLSDKGIEDRIFQALTKEKIFLVYGQKMLDVFKSQRVIDENSNKLILGNYRYHYYLKHKIFYKKLFAKEIKNLNSLNKTILYAPTWDGVKDPKYLLEIFKILIKNLNKNYNLIVKPHPNTYRELRFELERLAWENENKRNILFLKEFTPIYPLIDFCDIYLGDTSSIGYDFLTFNKPMFFLNHNKKISKNNHSLYLFRCGIEIFPKQYQNIFSIIEKNLKNDKEKFSNIRKDVYNYSFSKTPNFDNFLNQVKNHISIF